ncbi:MAG: AAA family ATPase [Polyangiaceae bacterium]|nr:AAA family ATPase [Polyangiaceae bacterium]
MRLVTLGLVRFGPFTDAALDFGLGPGGLHVIHGPNEAGKSTALRAVLGLLYGIHDATDAHMHRATELRLSGHLTARDGRELEIQRRKGRKNTLLDRNGEPMDEVLLDRMLGGVGRDVFRTAFGLDHQRLREGAEALLADEGDVGQSLFDAAMGGRGVKRVLDELASEAEALYLPRSNATRAINTHLRLFKEAARRARDNSTSAQGFVAQKKGLDAAESKRQELGERQRELATERDKLGRVIRAAPKLVRRAEILTQLSEFGELPILDQNATERRAAVENDIDGAERALRGESTDIARLQSELDVVGPPDPILELDQKLVDGLVGRLATQEKALSDQKKLRGELDVIESDLRAILAQLGRKDESPERIPEPTAREHTRVTTEARTHAQLGAAVDLAETRLSEAASELARVEDRMKALPSAVDTNELARAVSAARRAGDVSARLASARALVDALRLETEGVLCELTPFSGDVNGAAALRLPRMETVEQFDDRFRALATSSARLDEAASQALRAAGIAERDIDALRREGDVPSEADLAGERKSRDELWGELRRRFRPESAQAFERAVHAADELADRLRREAGRVAKLAQLEAERARLAHEFTRAEAERTDVRARREALAREWCEAWASAGFEPASPGEMRGFLGRHANLLDLVRQLRKATAERDELARVIDAHVHALRAALASISASSPSGGMLPEMLALAE